MVDAANAALEEGEEALDGLRVSVALDVDAGRVVDPPMRVTPLAHPAVDGGLVGKDHRAREDVFLDVGINLERGGSADVPRHDVTLALDHRKDRALIGRQSRMDRHPEAAGFAEKGFV